MDNKSYNQTALHEAALRGHVKCVDLLIKSGTDVNKEDLRKETALFYVNKVCNNHIQCADRIIAARADVNHSEKVATQ